MPTTPQKKAITADEWDSGDWNAVFVNFDEIYTAAKRRYGELTRIGGAPHEGSVDYRVDGDPTTKVCMEEVADGHWQFY